MTQNLFRLGLYFIIVVFTGAFCIIVLPPLFENPDIIGAFAAGFVNPYASGYSIDVFCCWFVLLIWVLYERKDVKHGWVCLILGVVPGLAVGLALYLLIRTCQLAQLTLRNRVARPRIAIRSYEFNMRFFLYP